MKTGLSTDPQTLVFVLLDFQLNHPPGKIHLTPKPAKLGMLPFLEEGLIEPATLVGYVGFEKNQSPPALRPSRLLVPSSCGFFGAAFLKTALGACPEDQFPLGGTPCEVFHVRGREGICRMTGVPLGSPNVPGLPSSALFTLFLGRVPLPK